MSDVFLSIAIALAAVASLVDFFWLLYFAWGSGALGAWSSGSRALRAGISGPNGWRSLLGT